MADHTKMFGICENKCLVEVSPKTDTEAISDRVGTLEDNTVKVSGNQTVHDVKTFDGKTINLMNPSLTMGTAPTSSTWTQVTLRDSVNNWGAIVGMLVDTSKQSKCSLVVRNWDDTSKAAEVSVVYPVSGSPYGKAPATPSDATGTEIATAGWVRSITQVSKKAMSISSFNDLKTALSKMKNNAIGTILINQDYTSTTKYYYAITGHISNDNIYESYTISGYSIGNDGTGRANKALCQLKVSTSSNSMELVFSDGSYYKGAPTTIAGSYYYIE